tara:strand:+ start:3670 stop:4101 length:432 start_codon:yes stop_codon:yes gene_type:complete
MANQSKLQYFTSCCYQNINDFDLYREKQGNFHFWVELNGVVIDKTILQAPPQSTEKVYIPFKEERMEKKKKEFIELWCRVNNALPYSFELYINQLYRDDNIYNSSKCFCNAYALHKNTKGSILRMGLFGYKMPCRTVDIDYGY